MGVCDKDGKELRVGDEVIVRGRIVAVPMDLQDNGKGILQVTWYGQVPVLDYVQANEIEKADDRSDTSA